MMSLRPSRKPIIRKKGEYTTAKKPILLKRYTYIESAHKPIVSKAWSYNKSRDE